MLIDINLFERILKKKKKILQEIYHETNLG